ncbi:hypothetical protein [Sanyastnella coralliicola]|uniref:hypothetical protein n=1 Tax=Sanyastnella coralliicola TaxID=3069118 RepID=UPI0027B954E7|nr:hypothetical protein [Longitalea sp. SCSIO 12813]MCH2216397.1 hypothetical protein [Flavobacteriales bacterium]
MRNLIVSLEKLPQTVLEAIQSAYPHGYDHLTFEFEHPVKEEIYTALRFATEEVNYVIKLDSREKNIDRLYDGG